ncbi:MAG TPA: phosphate acyltransferase PlsX [Gemmatimonadales bacterium]|nr:phosphate acyltransferase PlsX [Gemmatimonadales bacterium]
MIRIALDAMGGDHAPHVEVEGAALALRELPRIFRIQLVGRRPEIEASLKSHDALAREHDRLEIVEAPEVVGMGEKPLTAVKRKPRSSIAVGLGLQTRAASDAFVSAGNTGAVMAAATLLLGLHPGVARAAIGAPFPRPNHPVLVIDGGANVDCDARELVSFARLGTIYARDVLGRPDPAVGLLNVGEEDEKGNTVVKEANHLLKSTPGIRFVGNVEGRDILGGASARGLIDVVVCDGFVGNAILKFYEEAGHVFGGMLREALPDVVGRPETARLLEFFDYSSYGGAPLLGVKGVAIICHGSSPARAIMNAVRVAIQAVENHLSRDIGAQFAEGGALA